MADSDDDSGVSIISTRSRCIASEYLRFRYYTTGSSEQVLMTPKNMVLTIIEKVFTTHGQFQELQMC